MRIVGAILALATTLAAAPRNEILEGNPSSPVKAVIYEDLQCSDCAQLRVMMDQKILPAYGSRVAFIHRDFPLGKHPWARQAAVLGRYVYDRDPALGIIFRREIMAEQASITPENLGKWVLEFAARNHLDQKAVLDSMNDQRLAALVEQDYQGGIARGVSKTPTVFINNTPFVETIIFEDLARALDQALAR
jgi:protein-disulfide isomerase